MHVLDIEDPVKISLVRSLCRSQGITPPINVTNNGRQFVFATNGGPSLPGADKRITRLGFPVTDRSAGKNYCILGAILDAVSCSLRNHKTVRLTKAPRLADFAVWVTAAEPTLGWEDRTFLKAYLINRQEVTALTLDADQVGTAVKTFMESRSFETWEGTASELLDGLDGQADDRAKKGKYWPRSANALSGKVKRSATALRTEGIEVTIGHDSQAKRRFIRLEQVAEKIVPIVPNTKDTMQDDNILSNYSGTMFDERIDPGTFPEGKDRSRNDPGDDRNDPLKKIVPGSNVKDTGNTNSYRNGNDENDGNDDSPPPFQSDNLREVTL